MDNIPRVTFSVRRIVDATTFYESVGHVFEWGSAVGEVFMDIGCGAGHSSTQLLKVFPRLRKIIAIDKLPARIDNAITNNPDDKIEYKIADILVWSSLIEWEGSLSKIVSFFCFNFLDDQLLAFRNVNRLLKPGGTAAIKFQLHSPFFDIIKELKAHPKWKDFIDDIENVVPESHKKKYTSSYYKNILDEIGFDVLLCHEMETYLTYESDDDCRLLTSATIPLVKPMSSSQRQEFMDCTFDIFMKQNSNPERLNGLPYMKQNTLSIAIRKPFEYNLSD